MVRAYDEIDILEAVLEIKRSQVSEGALLTLFGKAAVGKMLLTIGDEVVFCRGQKWFRNSLTLPRSAESVFNRET